MPETQKPQDYPNRVTGQVLRELRIDPGMPNQSHLPTPKVSLTEKKYTPSKAKERVENITTLMDMMMDDNFLERCPDAKVYSFYISSKDIPMEIINALESLGPKYPFVNFKIDRDEGTLKPVSKEEFNMLNPGERGRLHRSVLEGIRKGGLLCISFTGISWWVSNPVDHGDIGSLRQVAFTEPTY